jgi:hypothetical protein
MPGRNFNSNNYKYGMNGQEKDDEVFQGAMTAEFWEYDSRIGRRWNLDVVPQTAISDYACFRNNPILFYDQNGAEATDTRLFDRKSGKQVGYNKDAMGKEYIVDDYGTKNKDGSFTHGKTVTPEDRQAVNNNATKVDNALSYSRNTSNIMNEFSKGACIGAVALAAAPLLPYALPAIGEGGLSTYFGGAALRTSIDAAAQMAANNGDVTKLDVGDALMSGFLSPGGSAVLGGAVDIRPFAAKDQPILRVAGVNKGVGESAFDAGAKFIFGRSGPIGSQYGKLGNAFGSIAGNTMSPLITAPFNLGAKIATKEAKKAIFGN